MKTKILVATGLLAVVILGVSINNIAFSSASSDMKVATVDLSELITNSASVKALKSTHEKQLADIEKTLEQARIEISNETNPDKIAKLEEKYRKDVSDKKFQMDKNYNDKLLELDKSIKAQVAQKAKELNYTVVLPKNMVLFGGEDITNLIAKDIK